VSTENHGDDARAYLAAIAPLPIGEIHLSGHQFAPDRQQVDPDRRSRLAGFGPGVALYEHTLALIGPRPTLIEWDSALPPLEPC